MMAFGMREGMFALGLLVVLALLLLAYRHYRGEHRNPIRMKAKPAQGTPASLDEAELNREIAGPPRVVSRQKPVLDVEEGITASAGRVTEERDIPVLVNRVALANTAAARRYREESQAEASTAGQGSLLELPEVSEVPDGPLPGVAELFVFRVLPPDEAGFDGNAVLQILLACDLRFGSMNIFHRHEESRGRGPVQFSVANLMEPGAFDLDTMANERLSGLCFFMSLPGPANPVKAFNYMVETAQCIVKNLGGELLDEAQSVVTLQTLEHGRQSIREFERRQLAGR